MKIIKVAESLPGTIVRIEDEFCIDLSQEGGDLKMVYLKKVKDHFTLYVSKFDQERFNQSVDYMIENGKSKEEALEELSNTEIITNELKNFYDSGEAERKFHDAVPGVCGRDFCMYEPERPRYDVIENCK